MLSPLYGQLSPLRVPTISVPRELIDADAISYIAAVETTDGQSLEDSVKYAYEDFILGCKSDGIWASLKASCILAGARTLGGALIPLVGTAPTNNNFVTSDYNRANGLAGNGTTKWLNTGLLPNGASTPQGNAHLSVYATTGPSNATYGAYAGSITTISGGIGLWRGAGGSTAFDAGVHQSTNSRRTHTTAASDWAGFKGVSRGNSTELVTRSLSNSITYSVASVTANSNTIGIFRRPGNWGNPTLSFYSIGESLDLALLDSRVSMLMTSLAAAIP